MPFGIRYGWDERTQLFASAPVGWADTELANPFFDDSQGRLGIGDVQFGFNRLLRHATPCLPALIGTVAVSAPTGDALSPLLFQDSGLGAGVWSVENSLLAVHSFDPVVVFYGVGYRFSFEDDFGANRVDLGDQATYNLGVGFAANEYVTLSAALRGAYVMEATLNGRRLPNSDYEPITMRFAVTVARCCEIIEPFAEIGMTETSPSATLGIIWTH